MRRVVILLAAGAALAGCGGSKTGTRAATASAPFADPPAPLGFVDHGAVRPAGRVPVHDVSFASRHGVVRGYLVSPPRPAGRLPAVIFLPGSGADRGEFVPTAKWVAARGAVALTLTMPSAGAHAQPASPEAAVHQQRIAAEDDVLAVRRAVDVLRARPDVDPGRIGLLGWSAGARTGAILAGVEPRLRTLVLMSAGAIPVAEYAAAAPSNLRSLVLRELSRVDPLRWIARGRPGTILLQDGRRDQIVPQRALRAIAAAAPPGTLVRWYDADHPLNVAAERDQLAWLTQKLAIDGPRVPGAPIGP